MADLFSHFAAASLPASAVRDRRIAALLVAGTFLPDLAAKGLYWVARAKSEFTEPTHSLAGLLLLSYGAALFVEERLRRDAFFAIFAGGVIHVLVDLLKDHLGMGAARLFYPFSTFSPELGLVDSLNVFQLIPFDLAALGIAWMIRRKVRRVQQ
jgi:membrane-bound metal-dependent hydrolase YbcI (DUF457 family)